ncbi:MAG: GntR family transcriptional regulator [Ruminococcus sp.]|nr:GntR family transcriptional regulator [Ruminococcus sp.]MDD6447875.1 GntR family transcriptional regulator [Ruminococcus sp.]
MINESTSLEYEKAINYIYSLICDGSLKVGSKLPAERAIAEKLGIGRNSTREALSILHGMGMITRVQGSGNYVSKNAGSSIKQIITVMLALGTITKQDVCEFRRIMEKSVCSVLINKSFSRQQEEHFRELLNEMKIAQSKRLVEIDKAFHDSLILATENTLFITVMEAVTEVYREWIDIVLKKADKENKQKLFQCHSDIFDSILNKDTEMVINAVDRHYDLIEEML